MRLRIVFSIVVGGLLLLASTAVIPAKDGRDFAGFYDLTDVTDLGPEIRVRFTAEVFNYSGGDANGATVTLRGWFSASESYASFSNLIIWDREPVRVSTDVIVPVEEYEYWRQGGTPLLSVEYEDGNGAPQYRPIELVQLPLGEGN